jgi:hypothetical protein
VPAYACLPAAGEELPRRGPRERIGYGITRSSYWLAAAVHCALDSCCLLPGARPACCSKRHFDTASRATPPLTLSVLRATVPLSSERGLAVGCWCGVAGGARGARSRSDVSAR